MYKGQQWQGNNRVPNGQGRQDDDMKPGDTEYQQDNDRPDGLEGYAARKDKSD